jgi:hypothetical protein
MPRIVLTGAAWQAVAHELEGTHTASAPPGLAERIQALLAQAPRGWPDQTFALELDASSAEAVRTIQAARTGEPRDAGQDAAAVTAAMQIIQDHQQRG